MHSGTTLLQKMLGNHPDVFIAHGETRFFVNLALTKKRFGNLAEEQVLRSYVMYLLDVIFSGYAHVHFTPNQGERLFDLAEHGLAAEDVDTITQLASTEGCTHVGVYRIVFEELTNKWGHQRWLDKLAAYVGQVDDLLEALPTAQVIELVRDPRDILVSKRKRKAAGEGYDPFWDGLAWRAAVQAGEQLLKKHSRNVLRIRYEDLAGSPEETLKTICDFTGLEPYKEMLEVGWVNATTEGVEVSGVGPGTQAIGRWRNRLTPGAIMLCQWVAGSQMETLGYKCSPTSLATKCKSPFYIARSVLDFFTRLRTRWKMGGWSYMRNTLANYLTRARSLRSS